MDAERGLRLQIRGQHFELLPERAIFWLEKNTLLLSDLHWGKSETFQSHGIPISSRMLEADLKRLTRVLARTQAQHLVVLGDLIHTNESLTETLIDQVAEWRNETKDISFTLIRGNHDRYLKNTLESWKMKIIENSFTDLPFQLAHEPRDFEGQENHDTFVISGHLHPTFTLKSGADRLRLPCFYLDKNLAILPAFSEFTSGIEIKARADSQIFVIADYSVIEAHTGEAHTGEALPVKT